MRFFSICVILLIFAALAPAQKQTQWRISDYFENLPKKYKTWEGDFSPGKVVKDDKNGYAAILDQNVDGDFAVIEMALFKRSNGDSVLVVSNVKADPVCTFYDTFFLERVGEKWIDVRAKVLPELSFSSFFDEADALARIKEISKVLGETGKLSMNEIRFFPPRKGTKMKASLELCEFVDEDREEKVRTEEIIDFNHKARKLELIWKKRKGRFEIKRNSY